MSFITQLLSLCAVADVVSAIPEYNSRAFDSVYSQRQSTEILSVSDTVVDLGYEQYRGVANASTGLYNFWG